MKLEDFLAAGKPTSWPSRMASPLRKLAIRVLMPYVIVVLHENEVLKSQIEHVRTRLGEVEVQSTGTLDREAVMRSEVQRLLKSAEMADFNLRALQLDHRALVARLELDR